MRQILAADIMMRNVSLENELTLRFELFSYELPVLTELCDKFAYDLKVISRKRYLLSFAAVQKRIILFLGLIAVTLAVLFLPGKILWIQVEGNGNISGREILAAAEEAGIRFGTMRKNVCSEEFKNKLLSRIPELRWAGVNTYGSRAIISVREKEISEPNREQTCRVADLVAKEDGIIHSCIVRRGTALCHSGQAVVKGQTLISGITDTGIMVRGVQADGEVYAETIHELTAVTPDGYELIQGIKSRKTRYGLRIGKKQIKFYDNSGIWDSSCGRMYREYVLTFPGGFTFPVALVAETCLRYETVSVRVNHAETADMLVLFSEDYLRSCMTAGMITTRETNHSDLPGSCRMTGMYTCTEMIGVLQKKLIGDFNG